MKAPSVLLLVALSSAPSLARAHPQIDAAREAFANAELEAALDALNRAEAAERLTREELAALYELRALVRSALQQTSQSRADLSRLASVAPDHQLSASAPPELRAIYAEIVSAGPEWPHVEVRALLDGDDVLVRAERGDDPLSLGRQLRVAARSAGAAFQVRDGEEVRVTPPLISPVAYYAQLLGPGGVVVTSVGEPDAPRLFSFQVDEPIRAEGEDDTLLLGLAIGGGAAAVVATIILVAVVASENAGTSDFTDVTLPDVRR